MIRDCCIQNIVNAVHIVFYTDFTASAVQCMLYTISCYFLNLNHIST